MTTNLNPTTETVRRYRCCKCGRKRNADSMELLGSSYLGEHYVCKPETGWRASYKPQCRPLQDGLYEKLKRQFYQLGHLFGVVVDTLFIDGKAVVAKEDIVQANSADIDVVYGGKAESSRDLSAVGKPEKAIVKKGRKVAAPRSRKVSKPAGKKVAASSDYKLRKKQAISLGLVSGRKKAGKDLKRTVKSRAAGSVNKSAKKPGRISAKAKSRPVSPGRAKGAYKKKSSKK